MSSIKSGYRFLNRIKENKYRFMLIKENIYRKLTHKYPQDPRFFGDVNDFNSLIHNFKYL